MQWWELIYEGSIEKKNGEKIYKDWNNQTVSESRLIVSKEEKANPGSRCHFPNILGWALDILIPSS